MGWLWVVFAGVMAAVPIALVVLAVKLAPRRRSGRSDEGIEWWTPPNH